MGRLQGVVTDGYGAVLLQYSDTASTGRVLRKHITYPDQTRKEEYHDDLERLNEVLYYGPSNEILQKQTYAYNGQDRLVFKNLYRFDQGRQELLNSQLTEIMYDESGRLKEVSVQGEEEQRSLKYILDANQNLLERTDSANPRHNLKVEMSLQGRDRVQSIDYPILEEGPRAFLAGEGSYVDNGLGQTLRSTVMQKDKLLRREFEFDAAGRLSGVHTRAYDLDGRVLHEGIRQELAYMPGGRLLVEDSKWQQNRGPEGEMLPEVFLSKTHHVYDGPRELALLSDSLNVKAFYALDPDSYDQRFGQAGFASDYQTANFLTDYQQSLLSVSPLVSSSSSPSVTSPQIQNQGFSVHGQPLEPSASLSNSSSQNQAGLPYGFQGRPYDQASGLNYIRARHLDTCTGRFLSPDPAKDGLNHSIFAHNDPANYIDPSGYADVWVQDGFDGFTGGSSPEEQAQTFLGEVKSNIENFLTAGHGTQENREYYSRIASILDPANKKDLVRFAKGGHGSWWNFYTKTLGESNPSSMVAGGPSCEPYNSSVEVYSASFRTGISGFQHQNVVHEFGHYLLGKGHSIYWGISGIQEDKLRMLKEDMRIQKADELGAYYYKFIHK